MGRQWPARNSLQHKLLLPLQEWAGKSNQSNQSLHHNGGQETLNNIFCKAVEDLGQEGEVKQKIETDTERFKPVLKIMTWTRPAYFSASLHAEAQKPCLTMEKPWKHCKSSPICPLGWVFGECKFFGHSIYVSAPATPQNPSQLPSSRGLCWSIKPPCSHSVLSGPQKDIGAPSVCALTPSSELSGALCTFTI